MERVLILYAAAHGQGHKSAAEALATAFRERDDVGTVRTEDALDYGAALYKKLYATFYRELSENLPAIWERIYEAADANDSSFLNHLRMLLDRIGVGELDSLIPSVPAEAVVCTHFLPLNILSWHRQNGTLDVPLYGVVTDYTAHLYWVSEDVNGYFVPSRKAKAMLAAKGVPKSRISVVGIPVDPHLPRHETADTVRRRHNITKKPVVTFICSALDADRIRTVVVGLLGSGLSGTLIVVPGRNAEAESVLDELEGTPELDLQILTGFVDYLADLVAGSDLVVTKAGGLVVSEVLAQGVPMLLFDPLGGQEEWNADYVVSTGAGVQSRTVQMVPEAIRRILEDPPRLEMMRDHAETAGRPHAAARIASRVVTGA